MGYGKTAWEAEPMQTVKPKTINRAYRDLLDFLVTHGVDVGDDVTRIRFADLLDEYRDAWM
jgi:hypothetical protein